MQHFIKNPDTRCLCVSGNQKIEVIAFFKAADFFRSQQRQEKPKIKPNHWYNVEKDGLPPSDWKVLDLNIITRNPKFKRAVYMDEWTGKKFASGDGVTDWMVVE